MLALEGGRRRIAGFRQQSGGSLNVNYPLWPEPRPAPDVVEAMRQRLQSHYDAKSLGPVPAPQGAVSEVSAEHLAVLIDVKPEVVSFHFGLPVPAQKSIRPWNRFTEEGHGHLSQCRDPTRLESVPGRAMEVSSGGDLRNAMIGLLA